MSVKKEASGRRSIEVEVEVPGSPEEVWQAIATGPGISSWFVPSEVEGREGGAAVSHFGPGMDSKAMITAWDPPHRFAAESGDLGENAPVLVTEWTVEARSGETCAVRVTHSLAAGNDDWDNQLTAIEAGWPAFFRILRLYLAHFRGERCSNVALVGVGRGPQDPAWEALTGALGLAGARSGERWRTPAGAPPLAGRIQQTGEGSNHHYALLLLDEPAPGIVSLIATTMGDKVCMQMSFYLYGDRAAAAAAHDEPLWNEWMNEQFASATA